MNPENDERPNDNQRVFFLGLLPAAVGVSLSVFDDERPNNQRFVFLGESEGLLSVPLLVSCAVGVCC